MNLATWRQVLIYIREFTKYLELKNYAPGTIEKEKWNLKKFFSDIRLKDTKEITRQDIVNYIKLLQQKRLTPATINTRISTIKHFFKYLEQENKILISPAKDIMYLFTGYILVKDILTEDEMKTLINSIPTQTEENKRDKA